MLSELIDLLTSNTLETEEHKDILARVTKASYNANYQWTSSPEQATAVELVFSLADYIVISDKIQEIHEQIQSMFDEDFPDFPSNLDPENRLAYFEWIDAELAQCGDEDGGCELLKLDPELDDNMHLFVVNRKDSERILKLAKELNLHISRPLTDLREEDACRDAAN